MSILYHLHVHGKYLPGFKVFCETKRQAQITFERCMKDYFPFDIIKEYIRAPSIHHWDAYTWLLETGHTINAINTTLCPDYRRLFLEIEASPNPTLLEEIAENRNSFGGVDPFIRVRGE